MHSSVKLTDIRALCLFCVCFFRRFCCFLVSLSLSLSLCCLKSALACGVKARSQRNVHLLCRPEPRLLNHLHRAPEAHSQQGRHLGMPVTVSPLASLSLNCPAPRARHRTPSSPSELQGLGPVRPGPLPAKARVYDTLPRQVRGRQKGQQVPAAC